MLRQIALVSLVTGLFAAVQMTAARADGPRFGGFDASRNGPFNPLHGEVASNFRFALRAAYPDADLVESPSLTADFLSQIDVMLIPALIDGGTSIAPLSPVEQANLHSFVMSGGALVAFTDNGAFHLTNQSMVGPFGLQSDPDTTVREIIPATVPNPDSHPVTNGPFGRVSRFTMGFAGQFTGIGTADLLATLPTGQAALAVIDRDVLGPGSGPVIMFSDTSPFSGIERFGNVPVVLNALVHAVGEPLSPVLAYSQFDEPALNADSFLPPLGNTELGFQTTFNATGGAQPFTGVINDSAGNRVLVHQSRDATTRFTAVDLTEVTDAQVSVFVRTGDTTYETGDSLRISITDGTSTIDLLNRSGGVPGFDDFIGDGFLAFGASIPADWLQATLVISSSTNSSAAAERFEFDRVEFRGQIAVPEPSAIALVLGGALLALARTLRRARK